MMCFLTLQGIFLFAQKEHNHLFDVLKVNDEDGLPSSIVDVSCSDAEGFVWITANGYISRFNGTNDILNYSIQEKGFSTENIWNIYDRYDGNLLFTTKQYSGNDYIVHLFLLEKSSGKVTKITYPNEDFKPTSFQSIGKDSTLISTEQGNIYLYNAGTFSLKYNGGKGGLLITDMLACKKGYWIEKSKKEITYLDENFNSVRTWRTDHNFNIVGCRKEGELYIREMWNNAKTVQDEDRILLLNTKSPVITLAPVNTDKTATVKWGKECIYLKEHRLFVTSSSFVTEDGNEIYPFEDYIAITPSFYVNSFDQDAAGNLFISSSTGLYYVNIRESKFIHHLRGQKYSMRKMLYAHDYLYCSTYDGRLIYDLEKGKIVERLEDLIIGYGLDLIQSRVDSCIYWSSYFTVLDRLCSDEDEKQKFITTSPNFTDVSTATLEKGRMWTLIEDSDGTIWGCAKSGIFKLNREEWYLEYFDKYNEFEELKNGHIGIYDMVEDGNHYWLATEIGLYKLDKEKGIVAHYFSGQPKPYYLPADYFYNVEVLENGDLWLATKGSGVIRFNPETLDFDQFTVREGLSNDVTNDILRDKKGDLWISTNNGITRINPNTGIINVYQQSEGVPIREFNKKSSTYMPDGRLIFGGLDGFVIFNPDDFEEENKEQNTDLIRFTKVQYADTTINVPNAAVTLPSRNSTLQLVFNHIDYFNKNNDNVFKWRWKDGKEKYKTIGKEKNLTLTQLPKKHNTLQIQAFNRVGVPIGNILELELNAEGIYIADWFLSIGVSCIFLIVFFFYFRNKTKKLYQEVIEKTEKQTTELVKQGEQTITIEEEKTLEPTSVPEIEEEQISEGRELKPADKVWLENMTQRVEELVEKNDISVSILAIEMNLSERQLNRKVKATTGLTPNQFIRDMKLEKAKQMLEKGQVSTVAEASYAAGFEKPNYFSNLFSRKYNKKPIEYLKDKN